MAKVIVDVMLKPEIHDPQGEAVLSASRRLGFGTVAGVRQGKRFELELDGPADGQALAVGNLLSEPARGIIRSRTISWGFLKTASGRFFSSPTKRLNSAS